MKMQIVCGNSEDIPTKATTTITTTTTPAAAADASGGKITEHLCQQVLQERKCTVR
jgi:hypothetical protein